MSQKLQELLARLRLKGIAAALDQELQRAEKEAIPTSEVICRLLQEEQAYRQNQSLLYRLKGAKIPWEWTLKTFPFDKQPGVSKAQISELSGLAFVERKENIVFIGNPGTGKSALSGSCVRPCCPDTGDDSTTPRTSSMNSMLLSRTGRARNSSSVPVAMICW